MFSKHVVLWSISFIFSIALLVVTFVIMHEFTNKYMPDASQITNEQEVLAYLENTWFKDNPKDNPALLVPTGVYIKSVYFVNSYTPHIAGFIWQKYDKQTMHIEKKGIVFAEGVEIKLQEDFRRMEGDTLIIGWHFEGKFIQNFDYFDFPIDNKTVWIRMWHEEFDKNIVLTPDFVSYDSTLATDKFGVDPEIVLSEYNLLETFFNYKESNYDTNFGIKNYIGKKKFPELYYNIVLKRNIINSAIVYFLPLWVVVTLMFFGILLISINQEDITFFGYNLLGLIGLASFLLFIIVVSHIQVRSTVTSQSIMYLEYLYVIAYSAIVYAMAIAMVVDKITRTKRSKLLGENGFYAKITYIPIISIAVFLTTFFSFYGKW